MEISAIGFGVEEEDDGSKVWTEHLTEELPALMERMMLAILVGCWAIIVATVQTTSSITLRKSVVESNLK